MRFHIGLSFNWITIKRWILPLILSILMFFALESVFAYSTNGFTYSNQVYVAAILNDSEHTGKACTTGDFCSISLSGEAETDVFRIYYSNNFSFTENKAYNLSFMVADTCKYFGTENGEKWYIRFGTGASAIYPEMLSSSCTTHEDGYSTIKISFKSTTTTNLSQINISHSYSNPIILSSHNYNVGFSRFYKLEEITDFSEEIFEQQKETNEKLDDLNDKQEQSNQIQTDIKDSITNPNVDIGTGNSFFDNFQTEDNGGISGIITAPLTLINSLLDGQGTCTDLKFPIMGKEVALPSGCIIWDKVPNEMEVLIQTLVCGIGAYFLLRELFKDIEKLKNPNNSEVSTLDL